MRVLKDTPFHQSMREKMKKHYYENNGRKKKVVRYYLNKHKLTREFLKGCTSLDDEIRHLKLYNLQKQVEQIQKNT